MDLNNVVCKGKNFAKKFLRKFSSSSPYINLTIDGENIKVKVDKKKINPNKYIEIRNRSNELYIDKPIDSNLILFTIEELLSIANTGFFDFYFKVIKNNSVEYTRIKFIEDNYFDDILFIEKNRILKSHCTKFNNLTLKIENIDFELEKTNLKIIDAHYLKINGKINTNNCNINELNIGLYEFFIEIRERKTGKRLQEKLISNEAILDLNDLFYLTDLGNFELFFKIRFGSDIYKKRIKYDTDYQFLKVISNETRKILKPLRTKYDNLTLKLLEQDFNCDINRLELVDGDEINIMGNLEVMNPEITNVTDICLISKVRDSNDFHEFKMDFDFNEDRNYSFHGLIDKISFTEKIIDLRLDFYIRIYEDEIYYENLLDMSTFKKYEYPEDRFIVDFNLKDNVYSYYVTENKMSLALWVTTPISWDKAYEIAKGKTIYDKTAQKEEFNKNMVFFESFFGKAYSGNPKYIYEKMLEMGMDKDYTFVWAYSGEDKSIIPGNPIIVDRYVAGDYYKYLALSKYWINNILFPIHKKRKGNVYLQTWHGTPLKKLGYDITIPGPEVEARKNFYYESRNWDYLISSNEYSTEIFKRAFRFYKEVLECGYPINDIFFKDNTNLIKSLKSKLGIDDNKKVILYAPTWKDDEQNASWEHYFNLEIDLERLYDEFGDEYVILLKMHHLVSENLIIDEKMKDFAIDLSSYDDIQELYILSDILITDYSSVFFDYAHSKKPILFFVPDLEHYISNVRGLYLNMEKELPGPLIKNNDELIDSIRNIERVEKEYHDKYEEFYERFCSLCKGESAKEIIQRIFQK